MASTSSLPAPIELQTQTVPQDKECSYKIKTITFLGQQIPIVLQNQNGPCPLLAICNVLLLKNILKLSHDMVEVSQEKLLSLVAERLIDSDSNIINREVGFLENQQQNVADAMDMLPRLATGIDVNIRFRRIHDFEFTSECAIFDLLNIPLCHGWIVDPQDSDTANAIGSKSYNALMGELVALEAKILEGESISEDTIDFAAATAATLGVPSPHLAKKNSFGESLCPIPGNKMEKTTEPELLYEEADFFEAIKSTDRLTWAKGKDNAATDASGTVASDDHCHFNEVDNSCREDTAIISLPFVSCEVSPNNTTAGGEDVNVLEVADIIAIEKVADMSKLPESFSGHDSFMDKESSVDAPDTATPNVCCSEPSYELNPSEAIQVTTNSFSKTKIADHSSCDITSNTCPDKVMLPSPPLCDEIENSRETKGGEHIGSKAVSEPNVLEPADIITSGKVVNVLELAKPLSVADVHNMEAPEAAASSVCGNEALYEGEECILNWGANIGEELEPMYEGEAILAEQIDKATRSEDDLMRPEQGKLIRNFFRINASQLTFYGLFCLQDGLKERELCVFFRNNHFNTMFKYNSELYLLVTDQGYLHEPNLVWEKLNEINGDTLFMTSSFKEFKGGSHDNDAWAGDDALASAADYGCLGSTAAETSDLQLAIALQQQEFEFKELSQSHDSNATITPQAPKNEKSKSSSSRPMAKSKDRCTIM